MLTGSRVAPGRAPSLPIVDWAPEDAAGMAVGTMTAAAGPALANASVAARDSAVTARAGRLAQTRANDDRGDDPGLWKAQGVAP